MKKHHLQIIAALLITILLPSFFIKRYSLLQSKKHHVVKDVVEYKRAVSEKSFVIIVPVSEETDNLEKQMSSIFSQRYEHYRVIYLIDSNSSSVDLVQSLIEKFEKKDKCSIETTLPNEAMISRYNKIIRCCLDDEIIVHLESRDLVAAENVLDLLNHIYCTEDIWLTYGQYVEAQANRKALAYYHSSKSWSTKRSQQNNWMQAPFKTFYASIFKQLSVEEIEIMKHHPFEEVFTYLSRPMAELSRKHIRFVPDILSIHNL